MSVATTVKNAATTVGSIVSEHGDTITKVTDKAGKTVKVGELSHQAANAGSFKDGLNTGLDAASLVVASSVGNVPVLGAVIQGGIGAAKVANNLAHGDTVGAKSAAIEGAVTAGASLIPGGGLATKVAKGALVVGGAVGQHVVSSGNDVQHTAAIAPAKTPGKADAAKGRHT